MKVDTHLQQARTHALTHLSHWRCHVRTKPSLLVVLAPALALHAGQGGQLPDVDRPNAQLQSESC